MASNRPAPPGWKDVRAVWLPPDEWARLERARKKRPRAEYARQAIMARVDRDLSPRLPDLEDLQEKMRDYPDDVQQQALDLVTACLNATRKP